VGDIFFGGRVRHKSACRGAGLSEEAVRGPKSEFRVVGQKFRSVGLINGMESPEFRKLISCRSR
jgi:hypothetical protein